MTATTNELLSRDAVFVDVASMSKEDAIRFVGGNLVERGHVTESYVEAMLKREETVSTFLGNGVAMPHGTFESKEAVISTGIVVAQFRDGIDWGVGTAHLVIGLGAKGDDHINVLAHIADVLQDEELSENLWTADGDELHAALNIPVSSDDDEPESMAGDITIIEGAGLHARPASLIVELAQKFDGSIKISKAGRSARADSIMAVLSLGAVSGDVVSVEIDGDDDVASSEALGEITRILTTPEAEL